MGQVQGSDIRERFAILEGSALPPFLGSRNEDLLRGVEAESRSGGQVHLNIKISSILLNIILTILANYQLHRGAPRWRGGPSQDGGHSGGPRVRHDAPHPRAQD